MGQQFLSNGYIVFEQITYPVVSENKDGSMGLFIKRKWKKC